MSCLTYITSSDQHENVFTQRCNPCQSHCVSSRITVVLVHRSTNAIIISIIRCCSDCNIIGSAWGERLASGFNGSEAFVGQLFVSVWAEGGVVARMCLCEWHGVCVCVGGCVCVECGCAVACLWSCGYAAMYECFSSLLSLTPMQHTRLWSGSRGHGSRVKKTKTRSRFSWQLFFYANAILFICHTFFMPHYLCSPAWVGMTW